MPSPPAADELRADVAIDAGDFEAGQARGLQIGRYGVAVRDAELVALQAGRDVGVRLRVDVGIDAQAHARDLPRGHGDFRQRREFGFALDVEAQHAGVERLPHLGARLADAREDDLAGVAAGSDHARQLAARDDVESAACAREGLQHGQARIGLHRIADEMVALRQCALVGAERLEHGGARIDVERRAVAPREIRRRTVFDVQRVAPVGDVRCARQPHRAGADAGAAVAAAFAGAGRNSGPFWPHPPSATLHSKADREIRRRAVLRRVGLATLGSLMNKF